LLGLTSRRVSQLAHDGIIENKGRNKYRLTDCVQSYVEYIRSLGIDRADDDEERRKAEVRLKRARARYQELETAELEGKMHRSEDVEAITTDLIYSWRGALLALPGRLAVDVACIDNPAEVEEVIRREIYSMMNYLAQYEYDPERYAGRIKERRKKDYTGIQIDE